MPLNQIRRGIDPTERPQYPGVGAAFVLPQSAIDKRLAHIRHIRQDRLKAVFPDQKRHRAVGDF